jgi:2-amino-4-hydroxy-6-hydroxymethyldihydropteridine diphosphokinase
MAPADVILGLGSNLGDREQALDEGLRLLAMRGFRPSRRSSTYLTEPVGGPPQDWFLNVVVAGESDLSAEDLLGACQATERDLGRLPAERWGPRTLDVDLLLYGDDVVSGARLSLPHPRMHERLFVLVPLVEIAPECRHPTLGLTARELWERCADRSRVTLYERAREVRP